jgi:hypothetical protein
VHCIIHFALRHNRTGIASWIQLHTLLGMRAEDMLHLNIHLMYCWKRYAIIVSIGSLLIIYCSIIGFNAEVQF